MKYLNQLALAITSSGAIFEDGVQKPYMAEKIGNLLAALEVFTDANFTEEEQARMHDIAGKRITELKSHGSEG